MLKILSLENYDRNDFSKFDMVKSLKLLRHLWKTLDNHRIKKVLDYEIVKEVMNVEERKAIRRHNKGKLITNFSLR